jgi:hypothetical protein
VISRRAAAEMTRRVERIARRVMGERADIMTDALAWACRRAGRRFPAAGEAATKPTHDRAFYCMSVGGERKAFGKLNDSVSAAASLRTLPPVVTIFS